MVAYNVDAGILQGFFMALNTCSTCICTFPTIRCFDAVKNPFIKNQCRLAFRRFCALHDSLLRVGVKTTENH